MKRSGWIARKVRIRKRKPFEPKNGPTTRELDALCRAVVFKRDGHKCRKCGAEVRLQWAHIYSRRYHSIRWNPDNSLTLCAGHHLWGHHRPLEFAEFVRQQVPERTLALLRASLGNKGALDRAGIAVMLKAELGKP